MVALLPILIVTLVPWLVDWGDAIEGGMIGSGNSAAASQQLSDLSTDMSSLAVAILAGVAILMRDRSQRRRSWRFIAVSLITALFAMLSIFASIRFRFAIAQQMMLADLDIATILDRFLMQMFGLLLSLSLLIALAASTYFMPIRAESGTDKS